MEQRREKKLTFLLDAAYWGAVVLVILLGVRLLSSWLLPFLLGFVIAFALRPLTEWICRYMKMRRRPAAIFAAILFYVVLGAVLWVLGVSFFGQLGLLLLHLPQLYTEELLPLFTHCNDLLVQFFSRFSGEMGSSVQNLLGTATTGMLEAVTGVSVSVVGWITACLQRIPSLALAAAFTVISSIFICADYRLVVDFLMEQLPRRRRTQFWELGQFAVHSFGRMMRAYLLICFITFLELAVGLWLLGVDAFLLLALVIALLDILPLIGSGGILVPWGIVVMLQGNMPMGIGLCLLWGVLAVVRNIIEPKIVGDQIGLHPLVTITAIFFGLKALGVGGIFLGPMVVLLVKYLNDTGAIHLYREPKAR